VTKNEIVAELFQSREFNECIGKMEPEHLRDDLRSEVILILLESPEEKIRQMHERGGQELKYYTVRVILNLIQSKTSKFYKQYRQQLIEITDKFTCEEQDIQERENREQLEEKAISEISNLYWYNKELLQLYMKHGNYRAIEEKTRIPYSSAYKTIQASIEQIKQKVLQ
jgi:hypothetical protein